MQEDRFFVVVVRIIIIVVVVGFSFFGFTRDAVVCIVEDVFDVVP